jgi:HlyD family secretion protein
MGLLILVVFFGVLGTWAALAPLDAGIYASGVVKVSGNRTTVQHRDGGVVSRVLVHDGDHVTEGQILVDLSASELLATERALASQSIELEATQARLQAESADMDHIDPPAVWSTLSPEDHHLANTVLVREEHERQVRSKALQAQRAVLTQRKAQLSARIRGYDDQIVALDEEAKVVADTLKGLEKLAAKGFASKNRVREEKRQLVDIDRQRAQQRSLIAVANDAIGEMDMQYISVQQDRAKEIAADLKDTETQLANVLPKWHAAREQLERSRVRAPTSGTVVGLAFFNPGAVVRPGERILDIVPDRQKLIIEARIRPRDADDLKPGMMTDVRLSAFEGRRVPRARGKVTMVSADQFHDQRTGRSYFTAEVEVSKKEMARVAAFSGRSDVVLRPGLPVQIVVPLRKRTALEYLLEPLNQALWRSFREH